MATGSPVRLLAGNDNWPPRRRSSSHGSSPSAKLVVEDFCLLLNQQRFQRLEKDVISIPVRCGSAPPSMEVYIEEIGMVYPNSSTVDSEIVPHPSSFSIRGSIVNLDERVSGHCGGSTGNDWKITPHTESADGSVQVNGKITPSHEEELEDDASSESSASASVDKAAMFGGHSDSLDPTQVFLPYDRYAASVQSLSLDDGAKTPTALNSDHHKLHKKEKLNPQENTLKQHAALPEGNASPVQGSYAQAVYPGEGHAHGNSNQLHHGSSSVSKTEVQPLLQTSGFTPPFYAPSTSFTLPQNSCYPNLPPVGSVTQQYSMGGYPFNSAVLPSYLTGYSPQSPVPLVFDSASFPLFGDSKGWILHAYDSQNLEQFYGQVEVSMQPPSADPYHLQQPTVQKSYGAYHKFAHQEERQNGVVSWENAIDLKKGPGGFQNDLRYQDSAGAGYKNLNIGRGKVSDHYSLGVPTIISHIMQFPSDSFVSPVVLSGPVGGTHFHVQRNNTSFSHSVYGNRDKMYGLQNQSCSKIDSYSFLEELKSGNGRRFRLSDITGHIGEYSIDQHGSRFIQQKLENCSVEEKASLFKEVVHASELMTDVFGNYVIQKLFEYGSPDQKKDLANQLESKILQLSLQLYGCRVIQKAFEVIDMKQKVKLARELDGHVLKCARDQNGNHVIQKCIECIPADKIEFIISSLRGQAANLSMHPYGCRVIQRVLEKRDDGLQTESIVNEILDSVYSLAQDQYGNYVTQHVLKSGIPREKAEIIKKLSGSVVQLSQHKFASSVVEKCLEHGDASDRDMLIRDIIGNTEKNDNILKMMKDQYANYVIQKILLNCTCEQRELLLGLIRKHLTALKKCAYGKHVVARFEQLYGEEIQTSRS